MKTIMILSLAAFLVAFSEVNTRIKLQEAIDKKLVKIKIKSLGNYQGESVLMELQNLTKSDMHVVVEPGRKLIADEDEFQNLLIVKEEEILVKASAKATKKLFGFCCESGDVCPKNELGYKANKLADSSLVKLANYVNSNYAQLNTTSIQQAIWAISNNHMSAAINTNTEKEMSLKNLVCTLKNEPIPWYIIKQKIFETRNGRIHLVNDSLLGKMTYSNAKWCYSKLNIYDANKNAVLISIGNWLLPGTNNAYNVALSIKQLAKGKYKLTLENDAQIFSQKDIQI